MPRKARNFDEKSLTKSQLRKLEALRKSLGPEIADKAFAEWLATNPASGDGADPTADRIADAVMELVRRDNINIPRGGYVVRRGRGRVIVEKAAE